MKKIAILVLIMFLFVLVGCKKKITLPEDCKAQYYYTYEGYDIETGEKVTFVVLIRDLKKTTYILEDDGELRILNGLN